MYHETCQCKIHTRTQHVTRGISMDQWTTQDKILPISSHNLGSRAHAWPRMNFSSLKEIKI